MDDGKADCEVLLGSSLPFAEEMLSKHGEFYPFGIAMTTRGQVVSIGGYDGRDRPPSLDVIDLLVNAYRSAAREKQYRATALICDVRTIPPGVSDKTDAVRVELEHLNGFAATVFVPYRIGPKGPVYGTTFATAEQRGIFKKL